MRGCLLALCLVLGLGSFLDRAPPVLVVLVPLDGLGKPRCKVGMLGTPAELATELGRIDGVTTVVARTVLDPIEVVGVFAHPLEDGMEHVDVVLLAIGADQVGLADAPTREFEDSYRIAVYRDGEGAEDEKYFLGKRRERDGFTSLVSAADAPRLGRRCEKADLESIMIHLEKGI